MTTFTFRTVPHIVFEDGGSERLASLAAPLLHHARRVVFITDKGVRSAGLLDAALGDFMDADIAVHVIDSVVADPPEQMVLDAAEEARRFGAQAVIGFGGGSPMDTAKIVALLLGGDQPLSEMYGVDQVRVRGLPLILVPTTAGTGSEVTNVAVLTTGATSKRGIAAPPLYAQMAVLDPGLTLGLPKHVTAATGIDAMVHAIEAYTNKRSKNPVSDALALAALKKLIPALERACADGSDRAARGDMLLGAMLAGQAFSNSPVGAVHAMAYPLGGIFHVPHGLSNSVVLPPVLKFNAVACEDLYAEIATHCGLKPGSAGLIDEMERLADAVGIERRLSQLGISHNDIPRMAEDVAANDRLLPNNPRELGYDDIVALYEDIL
ncbi:iron-containing alcohol dehydrogenase [Hyphobacterium marinum]|uniref:Iron-containing alcohol dehydrogenase n=1 Tax=Hyphobacterium marinum TaxID=3116574 RepID=A0ABU7LVB1_9PROT|nr:iron-containing alcohol dehydrogenase [Hyphobacterium sp. Y6023]MEE2565504.1 iron-containing alcohol dehydrogenase [Hyphobacterium sp. Y6023]